MKGASYDDCVFINCPFTPDYDDFFRGLIFAVVDCGFVPRCSLEKSNSGEIRIDKLYRLIRECRLGIHDISATSLDSVNQLPRFNMPLELGLFLGARRFGSGRQRDKSCLILDTERFRYQKFCSDIAGQDIKAHEGRIELLIRRVRDWLRSERPDTRLPGGTRMAARHALFAADLPMISESLELAPGELSYYDLLATIEEWLVANPW